MENEKYLSEERYQKNNKKSIIITVFGKNIKG